MRAATLFDFLLEGSILGSIMIALLLLVRATLRKQLGSRFIYFAWLLVAIRLLVPLSFPNPMMNELQPYRASTGVRPIANQVRGHTLDALGDIAWEIRNAVPGGERVAHVLQEFVSETGYGHTARYIALAYAVVALLVGAGIGLRNARFMRRVKKGRVGSLSAEQQALYMQLCEALHVKPVPVYWVDPLAGACLIGVFRKSIALPLHVKPEELTQVLRHELCHLKAHDPLWNLLRVICCAVHWFNPLVWLAASKSREDAELACDERVISGMDSEQRLSYANALAIAAAKKNVPGFTALATGMTMKGKRMKQRVKQVLTQRKIVKWLAICAFSVAFLGLMFSFGTAERLISVPMPELPNVGEAYALMPIQTEADAIERAQVFLSCPAIGVDVSELTFEATPVPDDDPSGLEGSWQVIANPYELRLGTDGSVRYLGNDTWDEIMSMPASIGTYQSIRLESDKCTMLLDYTRELTKAMLPDVTITEPFYVNTEPFYVNTDYETTDRTYYAQISYGSRGSGGVFNVQLLPEFRWIGYFEY